MQSLHSPYCVLGGGPAALIATELLRRKGARTLVVADAPYGNLAPLRLNGVDVSPIPIFAPENSPVYRALAPEPADDLDYVTATHSPSSPPPVPKGVEPGSFAAFMVGHYPDAAQRLVLAVKHLGAGVFSEEYPELQRKVLAQYPPGHVHAKRVGFRDGVSPYFSLLKGKYESCFVRDRIREIDLAAKRVMTGSTRISYDHLVSTLPMPTFLELTGTRAQLLFQGGGARMAVLSTSSAVRRNQLVYDNDERSPLYRVFVPREGFVVAQIARPDWDSFESGIAGRVGELLGFSQRAELIAVRTIENCYPLGVDHYQAKRELVRRFDDLGVTVFGRLGEWTYRDIDELDLERFA